MPARLDDEHQELVEPLQLRLDTAVVTAWTGDHADPRRRLRLPQGHAGGDRPDAVAGQRGERGDRRERGPGPVDLRDRLAESGPGVGGVLVVGVSVVGAGEVVGGLVSSSTRTEPRSASGRTRTTPIATAAAAATSAVPVVARRTRRRWDTRAAMRSGRSDAGS